MNANILSLCSAVVLSVSISTAGIIFDKVNPFIPKTDPKKPDKTTKVTNEPAFGVAPEITVISEDEMRNAIVFINGTGGDGTGFFAKQNGKVFLFTNIHVLMAQKKISITDRNGTRYTPVSLEAAPDRDIVRITVKETPKAFFEIATADLHSEIKIVGNAQGGGVLREVTGSILGTGPLNIETDAKFVQGHSGSPIIDVNWDVAGVATYASLANKNWLNSDTPYSKIRRFGYRLDTVKKWIPVKTKTFAKQAFYLANRRKEIEALYAVVALWIEDPYWGTISTLSISTTTDKWIEKHNDTVSRWKKRINLLRNNEQIADELSAQMQSDLKTEVQALRNDVKNLMTCRITKWQIPYLKEYRDENRTYATILNKLISLVEAEILKTEPVMNY